MKIYFLLDDIHPSPKMQGLGRFSFSVAALIASLKRQGMECTLEQIVSYREAENKLQIVVEKQPDIVLLPGYSFNFGRVSHLARQLKEKTQALILIGGPHATLEPKAALQLSTADFAFIGESDKSLPAFIEQYSAGISIENLPGIAFFTDDKFHHNGSGDVTHNLDDLPFVERKPFEGKQSFDTLYKNLPMMVSRGCPYSCSYCCNDALRSAGNLPKGTRVRSVNNVMRELTSSLSDFPYLDSVIFYDDIFPSYKKDWLNEFLKEYKKYIDLPFVIQSRIDVLDPEVASKLVEVGCREISVGIETGNESYRCNVLNKKISNRDILDKANELRKFGIRIGTYNMVGLPGQTLEDTFETIDLNSKIDPIGTHVSIYQPLPRTQLKQFAIKNGFLDRVDTTLSFYDKSSLSLANDKLEEISFMLSTFESVLATLCFIDKCPSTRLARWMNQAVRYLYLVDSNKMPPRPKAIILNMLGYFLNWNRALCSLILRISKSRGYVFKRYMNKLMLIISKNKTGEV